MEDRKVKITYLLNEKGRKASILAGGDGMEAQVVYADITAEVMDLARVSDQGDCCVNLTTDLPTKIEIENRSGCYDPPRLGGRKSETKHFFDAPQTAEALIEWEKNRRQSLEAQKNSPELQTELKRLRDEHENEKEQKKAIQMQKAEEKARREAEEKSHREKLNAEKTAWIAEHGSDFLKRAAKLGYDCQRKYITERAALEFPEYTVDFNNEAYLRSRSCPSEEALEEAEKLAAKGHEAKVVWLIYANDEEDDNLEEDCEAVIIYNFCGKYYLIKTF